MAIDPGEQAAHLAELLHELAGITERLAETATLLRSQLDGDTTETAGLLFGELTPAELAELHGQQRMAVE